MQIVRQNLLWAAVYNVVALPLAAAAVLTPLGAAVGMSVSSLLVVGNALRLLPRAPVAADVGARALRGGAHASTEGALQAPALAAE
jgi:Cu2+-exporting ATPase